MTDPAQVPATTVPPGSVVVPPASTTKPVFALIAFGLLLATVAVIAAVSPKTLDNPTFAVALVGAIPSLVAAMFAERNARDTRNGVLQAKVREGAKEAIAETGVMLRGGPVATAQVDALNAQLALAQVTLAEVHSLAAATAAQVAETGTKVDAMESTSTNGHTEGGK